MEENITQEIVTENENGGAKKALVLPVANMLLLPGTQTSFTVSDALGTYFSLRKDDAQFVAMPVKEAEDDGAWKPEDFHRLGVTFNPGAVTKAEKGASLAVDVVERIEAVSFDINENRIYVDYVERPLTDDLDETSRAQMLVYVKQAVKQITDSFQGGERFYTQIEGMTDLNGIMVYLGQFMPLSSDERYALLETDSDRDRNLMFVDYLLRHREWMKLNIQMNEKFSERANRYYREQALREQLRVIENELATYDDYEAADDEGDDDYRTLIEKSDMPDEAKEVALEEAAKLDGPGPDGAEQNIIKNYLDFMLKMPWKPDETKPIDLEEAGMVLDKNHYGLEKVKERIIEHLAVMQLKNDNKGTTLLLVGPPGTGKTSLGKSIAEALGRRYCRISLGGVRDEAEIRGHRKTYVGAMPGRILQGIKRAGSMNPVMVLDEVDKITAGGINGDPSSALMEVLDPEQNDNFTDHYLDVPYDLSHVFFIATANSTDGIPDPLLDRMEVIEVSGYTPDEKFHIAKEHLVPEVLADHGIMSGQFDYPDEVIHKIIADYTMEAGVRGLKKQLAALARKESCRIVSEGGEHHDVVELDQLEDALGREVSHHEKAGDDNPPGVVTGLAWTPVGGEILFIETTAMPGTGQIILTGQLGDVMQESARISLSLLKSRLPLNAVSFKECDIHIHVPSGSVPKDGPSAGIALFTALASLVTGRKVDPKLAMTGEITLRGDVTPIGGLKEKIYGAHRAGIRRVIVPEYNVPDLKDIADEVKNDIEIIPVRTVEDVLRIALDISLPRLEQVMYRIADNGGTVCLPDTGAAV